MVKCRQGQFQFSWAYNYQNLLSFVEEMICTRLIATHFLEDGGAKTGFNFLNVWHSFPIFSSHHLCWKLKLINKNVASGKF